MKNPAQLSPMRTELQQEMTGKLKPAYWLIFGRERAGFSSRRQGSKLAARVERSPIAPGAGFNPE